MLAAPTGGERDNAMRFTNVDVSLRQRPIRETRALPGARRQLQSEAVAGLHEERELVAVEGVAESGRTGGADQDNRPDDDVSRAFERPGEVCFRAHGAARDNAARSLRRQSK